jgi:hypothetical protein
MSTYAEQTTVISAPRAQRPFGVPGLALAVVGGVLLVVAFTGASWFSQSGVSLKFHYLKTTVGHGGATGVADAYFSWAAWVVFVVAVAAALIGNVAGPPSTVARVAGIVLGVGGVALSFVAVRVDYGQSYTYFLKHAGPGFYLAAGGYLLVAVASGIGPGRVKAT